MNPEIAKKLMSEVPEMRDFVRYIRSVCDELNRNDDIETEFPEILAGEVMSRRFAYKKLQKILSPLLDADTREALGPTSKEYVA